MLVTKRSTKVWFCSLVTATESGAISVVVIESCVLGVRKNRNFAQLNLPVFKVKKVDQTSINYDTLAVL